MTTASLFTGIGGFDLAADYLGWQTLFQCEINKYCHPYLKKYWPNAKHYADITKNRFTEWRNRIDVLTGGFPCQPFSTAGLRKGTEDNRFMWPHFSRVIDEVEPPDIVAENVRGLISQQNGMVFEQICIDLESKGYIVQPFIIPAASVNAPHRRERTWIIAHSNLFRCKRDFVKKEQLQFDEQAFRKPGTRISEKRLLPNTFENFPTEPGFYQPHDGLSEGVPVISDRKNIQQKLRAYGNAIVPQVAIKIFEAIEKTNSILYAATQVPERTG